MSNDDYERMLPFIRWSAISGFVLGALTTIVIFSVGEILS